MNQAAAVAETEVPASAVPAVSVVPASEVEDPEVAAVFGTAVEPLGFLIDEKTEKFRLAEVTEQLGEIDAGAEAMSSIVKVSSDSSSEESSESEMSESEDLETSSSSSDDESLDVITNGGEVDAMLGAEEGEIRGAEEEEMVTWSDEDVEALKGPIKSKNEIEDLPPVPQVEVSLEPHHQTSSVGVISSILGSRVIVEGTEKHNPLCEGSILWITETRLPLGLVDEIFGPVKNPYYIVRYNSDKEVPAGINIGSAVSFVVEFAHHILNQKDLHKKGYDASGVNDGESTDEAEFSDDEKEAEYRRSLRQSKRVSDNATHGKQKTPLDKRTHFKSGSTGDTKIWNRESTADMSRGHPQYGRWNNNQDHGTNSRTNFKGHPSNDRRHANQESPINRADLTAAPHQRSKQSPFPGSRAAMGQPLPSVQGSAQALTAPFNNFRPDGTSAASGNVFGSYPPAPAAITQPLPHQRSKQPPFPSSRAAMGQPLPSVQGSAQAPTAPFNNFCPDGTSAASGNVFGSYPPAPAATTQPLPFGTCFNDLSQQLVQQINALVTNAFRPQMATQGGYPMNALPSSQPGEVPYQSHHQNQFANSFLNAVQCQQQFVPNNQSTANPPWNGGFMHVGQAPSGTQAPVQFTPSGQVGLGFGNGQNPWASGSFDGQSHLNPQPSMNQGGMHQMQFNPANGPMSFGLAGQASPGDAQSSRPIDHQGASSSSNMQNYMQHQPSFSQNGMNLPMQFIPSVGPTSLGQPPPASDQGGMRPMQFNPSVGPTSLGQPGALGQPPPASDQGGMRPMQFNPSVGPASLGQPPPASDQGGMRPMQFNPGWSSFQGRNTTQRGGRHGSFGRGGQSQTR